MKTPNQSLPIKLLAIDLDHTLIGFGLSKIDPKNVAAIKQLHSQSLCEVVIVTGRSFLRSFNYAKTLKLNYHICFGGALTYDLKNQTFCAVEAIDFSALQKVKQIIENNRNLYAVFYVFDEKTSKINSFTINQPNAGFEFHQIDNQAFSTFNEAILQSKIVRINIFTNQIPLLNSTFVKIDAIRELKVNKNYDSVLEITSINGHKGAAVANLVKKLNISQANTGAIVDSLNDVSLVNFVKYRFAVANANPLIKQLCQYHTSAFDQQGVANAIKNWILK